MKCQALFSLKKKKREKEKETPSIAFVFESLSDLVYCSCSQQIQCEGNCFILKDVKFTEKLYPLNLISMLVQNSSEYFYPLSSNFNADFQKFSAEIPFTPSYLVSRALNMAPGRALFFQPKTTDTTKNILCHGTIIGIY